MSEFRLFDTPGAEVAQIETDGATIKPYLNAINTVADEAKIRVREDGLYTAVVDPAYVFMGTMHVPAGAFETYEVNKTGVIAPNIGELQSAVRRARKNSDDELTLSLREMELTATVERDYGEHEVVSQSTLSLIDPDSVKEEPDLPDLDMPVDVSLDYDAFMDAFGYGIGAADHTAFETKPVNQHATALYIGAETDIRTDHAAISGIKTDAQVHSKYSTDYLKDLETALQESNVEEIGLRMGDEFPLLVRTESDTLVLEFALAPRIESK